MSLGPQPVGVRCPHTSSLSLYRWVSRLVQVSCATAHVGVHRLFPFAFHISVFFHSLFKCLWISFVFLLYDRRICTHSLDPSLPVGEFPGLGLALHGTRCCGPRGGTWGAQEAEISFQISGRGLNLGPRSLMAANVITRLRRSSFYTESWNYFFLLQSCAIIKPFANYYNIISFVTNLYILYLI